MRARPIQLILMSLFCLSLAACNASKEANNSPELKINYERHVLDNGLTVLIHEDHSDPLVHVDVTYHVGSAREQLGKSGFAHLFEHMMFQGSENVADEEHFKIVTEAGGTMNGTTNRDRTNYFQTVPSNYLETMLWLEADRMGFFLEGITQKKFEVQRATVINEKQQNYDNRAYGRTFELIAKGLYPYGHPYSWLTIGDLEDLDRADAQDLRNFFLRWYGPNNATLTIGGDVDAGEAMKLVNKYFAGIARGPDVQAANIPGFELSQDRYLSYYDEHVRFPAVTMTFPTVKKFHPDAAALRCLANILGGGKSSYLYQNLVASRKALEASASQRSDELAGEFFMFVLPFPGADLGQFEQELRQALAEFEAQGPSDADLQKYKAQYESSFVHGLETVSGKVSQLAYYNTFAGDPAYFDEELEAHLSLSNDDVMRVYNKYIKDQPSVIVSILAEADGKPAKSDNYKIPHSGPNPYPQIDYSGLVYHKAKDSFDRSVKPQPGPAKLVEPPQIWRAEAADDIAIIGSENHELPIISLQLSLPGGYLLDNLKPEQRGLSSLSASMLNTSTENYSEKAMAEELALIGSSISVGASAERFTVYVSSLSKHFDRTLELLEEKLLRPAFNDDDFARLQQQTIESAKAATTQTSSIASMVYNRLLYGPEHSFGIPATRLVETVPHIRSDDTKHMYNKHFGNSNAEIVVVGDIKQAQLMRKLDFFFNWRANPAPDFSLPNVPAYSQTKLYFANKDNAAQSEIRIGYVSDLRYDATGEYFERYLMNFPLGGAFNSRINLNLREDKAITYGARSWFEGSDLPAGNFTVSTSVKKDGTALAVKEIMKELEGMRSQGIRDDELSFLKSSVAQRDALKYESNRQKSGFLANMQRYGLNQDYVDKQKTIIDNIGKKRIDELAGKYLPTDNMIIVVVGDGKAVLPELKQLGYELVEVDEQGQRL
ncbi:M16 family metallopeptidase [Agaribacterium haliotis]|uniref:M16 family metallopeptidase n=1 Tax=Agaribacterium haliotis TaxID=2013869 RepID=UPI000BB54D03|nr:pitrilysin family protein [Agaribacterium haliotis]